MRALTVTSVVRYYDFGSGEKVETESPPKVLTAEQWADALKRLDAAEKRRERRKSRKPRALTDLGLVASLFEGPRVDFSHFVGQDQQWSGPESLRGPDGSCTCCGHLARLTGSTICLACLRASWGLEKAVEPVLDRSMDERSFGSPQVAPPRVKVRAAREGLRGGRG